MDGMVLKIYSYSSWTPIVNAICSKNLTDKLMAKKNQPTTASIALNSNNWSEIPKKYSRKFRWIQTAENPVHKWRPGDSGKNIVLQSIKSTPMENWKNQWRNSIAYPTKMQNH